MLDFSVDSVISSGYERVLPATLQKLCYQDFFFKFSVFYFLLSV